MAVNSQAKAPRAIVGPVIADLDSIGAGDVTIATAFYSMGALNALNIEANSLRLFVRLDLTSPVEWALGSLNPPALRDFIQRHYATCNEVALFVSPSAHAKIYSGNQGYFIGSANLSTQTVRASCREKVCQYV